MRKALLIISGLAISLIGCSTQSFISNWNEDKIVIDGSQDDWEDNLNYFEDEGVSVGVFNDDEYFYLCLTSDEMTNIQQILNPGITILIFSNRPDVRTRGIRYPLLSTGIELKSVMELRMESYRQNYIANFVRQIRENQTEFQIINDDNYLLYTYHLDNGSGVEIMLGGYAHRLVYETAIPIAGNEKGNFSMELFPGDKIRIEINSNNIVYPEKSNKMITGTGGRTGVPGAEIYSRPVPIDFKFDVRLSESP